MPALQVKDCPDEVYEKLRECAARENRSISQQTLTILEEYLGFRKSSTWADSEFCDSFKKEHASEPNYIEKRKKLFDRINSLPSFDLPEGYSSIPELINDIRENEAR